MWSYFSRDPIANFNYDIGEVADALEGISLWKLHEGKSKASGDRVSIFALDVKAASETQLETARTTLKRIKTLRHPNVISYVDSVENASVIYVVTEWVSPLRSRLAEIQKTPVALSWGLHQVAKSLDFLNNSCNLIHNNISLGAIFVDKAGEWKLGGFEFMYSEAPGVLPPVKILPCLEKYEPPERSTAQLKKTEKWSTDVWGLGCLVWEIFNGELVRNTSLKSPGKIPKNLVTNYAELVSANPRSRPAPASFLSTCRLKGGFMSNEFVDTMLFIEEIQIKENEEKQRFFGTLTEAVDSFPDDVCRHKILPQLLNAYEFAGAGSAVLPPLFKLSRLLSEEEYQKKIVPSVVKLFSSSDRTTRVRLLQQCEFFIKHLQVSTVNDQIFPQVVHGFMDTNPTVREHTIKAMVFMAEKLNYNNLNEELMKHFARLQSRDDQGGIRTNTTVCLGKIAGYINPERRQKVLVSAFARALRDPFPPARQAGVLALAATHQYYTLNDVAAKIIPPLVLSARDPEKSVRDQAFKAIKLFIGKLEKVSEHPEEAAELEKEVTSSGNVQQASAVAAWAGWAIGGVGSLTSKIYSKGSTPAPSGSSASISSSQSKTTESPKEPPKKQEPPVPAVTAWPSSTPANELSSINTPSADDWGEDKGWDDFGTEESEAKSPGVGGWEDEGWEDFGDMSSQPDNPPTSSLHSKSSNPSTTSFSASAWNVDDFAPANADVKPASSYNWDVSQTDKLLDPNSDSFFDALPSNTKKSSLNLSKSKSASPKPKITTAAGSRAVMPSADAVGDQLGAVDISMTEDGWGSWGRDVETVTDPGLSKADLMKQKREARRQEMEKKRANKGGAMKLGVRKTD